MQGACLIHAVGWHNPPKKTSSGHGKNGIPLFRGLGLTQVCINFMNCINSYLASASHEPTKRENASFISQFMGSYDMCFLLVSLRSSPMGLKKTPPSLPCETSTRRCHCRQETDRSKLRPRWTFSLPLPAIPWPERGRKQCPCKNPAGNRLSASCWSIHAYHRAGLPGIARNLGCTCRGCLPD